MTKGQTYGTIGAIVLAGAIFRGYQFPSTPSPDPSKKVLRRTLRLLSKTLLSNHSRRVAIAIYSRAVTG